MLQRRKATRASARLRLALIGISGSGKTFSALDVAFHLGSRVLLIDSERQSASKYVGELGSAGCPFDFEVIDLEYFSPQQYVEAIELAYQDCDVLIIDSLSHAWSGKGGALEMADNAQGQGGNKFAAWRNITPLHHRLVDSILACPAHVIVTMRAKTEYAMEKDDKTGRTSVRKVGLAPVQRDGLEYEFDVVADMDNSHNAHVTKSRCRTLSDRTFHMPTEGREFGRLLGEWLGGGATPEWLPLPDLRAADTEALRDLLAAIKNTQPDHPRKREVVAELTARKNAMGQRETAETPPAPAAGEKMADAELCAHIERRAIELWGENAGRVKAYKALTNHPSEKTALEFLATVEGELESRAKSPAPTPINESGAVPAPRKPKKPVPGPAPLLDSPAAQENSYGSI